MLADVELLEREKDKTEFAVRKSTIEREHAELEQAQQEELKLKEWEVEGCCNFDRGCKSCCLVVKIVKIEITLI